MAWRESPECDAPRRPISSSMEDSQRLNELILGHFDRMDMPHPRGAAARLYDWGDIARHSHAAHLLIEQAHGREAHGSGPRGGHLKADFDAAVDRYFTPE